MRLAQVTGTVTATEKHSSLVGSKLMLCDFIDARGNVLERGCIAVDEAGSGVGDRVIIANGSAARVARDPNAPVDSTIIAIVDDVSVSSKSKPV